MNQGERFDVAVIGAGAAGVGIGVALKHAGIENFTILDRFEVGASFTRWPKRDPLHHTFLCDKLDWNVGSEFNRDRCLARLGYEIGTRAIECQAK